MGQQPRGHVGENELIDVERQKVQEGEEGMPSSKSSGVSGTEPKHELRGQVAWERGPLTLGNRRA